jgi:uncharacterized membrane protein YgcG
MLSGLLTPWRAAAAPSPAPAPAPKTPAPDPDDEVQEVVVRGKRIPQVGGVVGDIKPELQLSPADIQSYGVSSVTELLEELAPETRSDRGRGGESPVVLLNGHRISSFNEIQNIPTEAILRVDILPEEVSLKYGYTANQRVVNIVLRRRFRAITGEGIAGAPTEGGEIKGTAEADLLNLRGDARLNLDLKYTANTALSEHARGVVEPASSGFFDTQGNVVSPTGGQIDPAYSLLAGQAVTVAGVPAVAATRAPTLLDFLPTASTPNATDVSRDRTLVPAAQNLTLNGVLSQPSIAGTVLTLNGTLGATTSDAKEGLGGFDLLVPAGDPFSPFSQPVDVARYDPAFGPLRQTTEGWTAHMGATLNKDTATWRYSLTGAYDHGDSLTRTDTGLNPAGLQALLDAGSPDFNPFGALPADLIGALPEAKARSLSDSANLQVLANGPALKAPAGDIYTSLKIGDSVSAVTSHSSSSGLDQSSSASRNTLNAQINVDIPLLSDKTKVLDFLGDVSINGNAAIDELSDFGALKTYGYGVNWTPLTGLNLIVSQTHDEAAPTVSQLAGALLTTPGQRIFDYVTGQTVDVTTLTGGNTALKSDSRTVSKIGLTWKPLEGQDLTLTANYIASDIKNPIASFPAVTPQIEAAFPTRFTRDADGDLTEVDFRPVNFADQRRTELRWGLNFAMPVGPAPPPRPERPRRERAAGAQNGSAPPDDANAAPAAGTEDRSRGDGGGGERGGAGDRGSRSGGFGGGGGGGGRGGGGRGGFAGPRGNQGRLQIAVYHTVFLTDQILVRQGGPLFDLLHGAAAGSTGGQPRQEIEAQLGYTQAGFGARISADWKSGTTVNDPTSPAGNLNFSDIGTANLRLFANLGQMPWVVKAYPSLRGSRLTLSATNLFDARQRVTNGAGMTPLSYQPAYLDPTGRVVSISFRKLFF